MRKCILFIALFGIMLFAVAACAAPDTGDMPSETVETARPIDQTPSATEKPSDSEEASGISTDAEIPEKTGSAQLIATIEADGAGNLGLTIVQAAGAQKAIRVYDFDDSGACIRYVQIYYYENSSDAAFWYESFLKGEGITLEGSTVVEIRQDADIAPEASTLEKAQAFCEVFSVPFEIK